MPKINWSTRSLTDADVFAHLVTQLDCHGTVMIDAASRRGRRHLRLHVDTEGYFVRVGQRGSGKMYLGRCKVTSFDDKPTIFQFTFAQVDAFEAEQVRRFNDKWGT